MQSEEVDCLSALGLRGGGNTGMEKTFCRTKLEILPELNIVPRGRSFQPRSLIVLG